MNSFFLVFNVDFYIRYRLYIRILGFVICVRIRVVVSVGVCVGVNVGVRAAICVSISVAIRIHITVTY